MIVLVTGSRNYTEHERIEKVLGFVWVCCSIAGEMLQVRHGHGGMADLTAHLWALGRREAGMAVTPDPHPAAWNTYGRAAGHIRNSEMIHPRDIDLCLAFGRDNSSGTADCMGKARDAEIPVWFHPFGLPSEPPPPARLIQPELWSP